jgi:hypothetical protein
MYEKSLEIFPQVSALILTYLNGFRSYFAGLRYGKSNSLLRFDAMNH